MMSFEPDTAEVQGNARTLFKAIAQNRFDTCRVAGPARAGAMGSLFRRHLIEKGDDGAYTLTEAGQKLWAAMNPPAKAPAETPAVEANEATIAPVCAPTETSDEAAKSKRGPTFNARTVEYVRVARETFGCALGHLSDADIARHVWRPATVEKAIEKARELACA